jgi:peroxiredoxin Q/BCP
LDLGREGVYNQGVKTIIIRRVIMPIASGVPAPEFELKDQTGQVHSLQQYRGQPVVLYFYPKDDTPGCTTEACNFRDDYSAYEQAGVTVIGVSPDTTASHAKFASKYSLQFPLLADPDHSVADAYGVWGPKKMYGKEYYGILRTTFLINREGEIERVFENVKPAEHSKEVLAALAAA